MAVDAALSGATIGALVCWMSNSVGGRRSQRVHLSELAKVAR